MKNLSKKRFRNIGYHLYSYEYLIAQQLIEIDKMKNKLLREHKKLGEIAYGELTNILSKIIQRLEQLRQHIVKEREHFEKLCTELGYDDILKYVQEIEKSLYGTHLDYRLRDADQNYDLIFETAQEKLKRKCKGRR